MGRSVFVHFVGNTILLFNVATYFQMSAPPYFFRFTFYISKCQFPKSKIMGFVKTTFCPCAANGTEKAPYIYPQKPLLQHDGHFMILDSYIFLIQYFLLPLFSILSVTYFVRFTTTWSIREYFITSDNFAPSLKFGFNHPSLPPYPQFYL